ncbi:MAG: ACR3 family arsenite efflux transporter, partial [Blastococcus sp.]
MSDAVRETARTGVPDDAPVLQRLSTLDQFLPVWILAAMALGLGLGRWVPGLDGVLSAVEIGHVSLPIAIGLLLMMYPVLAKVRYSELGRVTGDRRMLGASLVLNWLVGPALMFALAWLLLPDLPEYRTGLIIVGLARCIAMVLIWNDLACGDREAAAVLVALNSIFQIVAFAALGWFYLQVLPGWLGLSTTSAQFSVWAIVLSVLVFLGIPLLAGFLTRTLGERARGREWYEGRFLPRIGPIALYGLLFTIVLLFALQGDAITSNPWDVARIALPLLAYFALM